ncbi:twin-arginine translocase subunit TatB [Oleomonas cavernae]|uniref:Sec-independent protein translocase protein TatB n=1 Tax=Oleomonas cavernae TaxID=2320859 RepID=A0A418WBB4_9PROT|nr:Sec-independent protein translocase protein TatB [Oleomonas cavernae]RJF87289.1 twin-arginine translocase subunit TatB [Oleomonas cavernae]
MFDLAWSEILLVGIVALLVVGPKELPDLLRTVGRWVRRARGMASNFQSTFDQMMRDEEMAKAKADMERAFSGSPALPQIEKPPVTPEPALGDKAEVAEALPAEELPLPEANSPEIKAPESPWPEANSPDPETPKASAGSTGAGV